MFCFSITHSLVADAATMPSCRCHRSDTNAVSLWASLCLPSTYGVCVQSRVWSTSTRPEHPTSCYPNTAAPSNTHPSAASRRYSKAVANTIHHLHVPRPLFDSTPTLKVGQYCSPQVTHFMLAPKADSAPVFIISSRSRQGKTPVSGGA